MTSLQNLRLLSPKFRREILDLLKTPEQLAREQDRRERSAEASRVYRSMTQETEAQRV